MSDKYVLDENGSPKPAGLVEWAEWFGKADRHVAIDKIGESKISTIFLGIDHSFGGPTPILWETMVFGGGADQLQDRCGGSREQAEAMHAKMVELVKSGAVNPDA